MSTSDSALPFPVILTWTTTRSSSQTSYSTVCEVPLPLGFASHLVDQVGTCLRDGVTSGCAETFPGVRFVEHPGGTLHPLVQRMPVHRDDVPRGKELELITSPQRLVSASGRVRWQAQTVAGETFQSEQIGPGDLMTAVLFTAPEADLGQRFARLLEVDPSTALYLAEKGLRYIGVPRRFEVARDIISVLREEDLIPLLSSTKPEVRLAAIRVHGRMKEYARAGEASRSPSGRSR